MTTLSFYPTKIIGGIGDGGMKLCQSKTLAERSELWGIMECMKVNNLAYSTHTCRNDRLDEFRLLPFWLRSPICVAESIVGTNLQGL